MKILFVCMGNICRSPSGENVMQKLVDEAELADRIQLDSAGTINFHEGKPPDARMSKAGRARGLAMSGSARRVRSTDYQDFDLILAMDDENLADLQTWCPPEHQHKLRRFCDLLTEHDFEEVPDPYYGGDEGFELVLDLLEDGCRNLLAEVQEKDGQ